MIIKRMFILYVLAVIGLPSIAGSIQMDELMYLMKIISGNGNDTKPEPMEMIVAPGGYTRNSFLEYATKYHDTHCASYRSLKESLPNSSQNIGAPGRRTPIKVKCLRGQGNETLQIIQSLKEVVALLAPHGNSTKRTDPGNCALVLFYTKTCPISGRVAPHFNAVSKQFPDLHIGAIDALRFHGLNTDFGIVGVPTVMLFHQGRPVVKFNDTPASVNNFNAFVTRHTGIQPKTGVSKLNDFLGPLSYTVEVETDYCLYLAWIFIIVCACYYFTKSKLYSNIVEVIKRNWQESEAQHEHQL